ncbi:MAG: glycosyltransferase family 2 protein [Bacteroidales bacterium]|nr:glycosyltransferase family 2 protein [Bacteroidales bacterium]
MTGVVVLNYNNAADTLACVNSLKECCRGGNWKLCVVDNASRPEVAEEVGKALAPEDKYIINPRNLGYAAGNNAGLRWLNTLAEVDNVLILNSDIVLSEDIVTPMEEYLASHPECGALSPLLLSPSGQPDYACARRRKTAFDLLLRSTSLRRLGFEGGEFILKKDPSLLAAKSLGVEVISGACMMLPKKLFSELGFFDEGTFLYFEEDILCEKLRRAGRSCTLLPQISAVHKGAASTSRTSSSFLYKCYRDSLIYYMGNYTSTPSALRSLIRLRTGIALKMK